PCCISLLRSALSSPLLSPSPYSVFPRPVLAGRACFVHLRRPSLCLLFDLERTAAPDPEARLKLHREGPGSLSHALFFAASPPVRVLCESASASPAPPASGLGVSLRAC